MILCDSGSHFEKQKKTNKITSPAHSPLANLQEIWFQNLSWFKVSQKNTCLQKSTRRGGGMLA